MARVAGQRGLELAGQVREGLVADVAALDLLQRLGAVDDLVLGHAGDRRAEERPRRVAARLGGVQAGRVELLPDRGDVLDADPVVLDVLAVGDVGGVAGVLDADLAQRPDGVRAEQPAVGADPEHEVGVVELLLLEHRGLAAVEARGALGVEPHPPEPAAQVGGVDGGEAALGVDVEDAVADVERVVVLLGLLVLVQRLGVAERPLTLTALGARDIGVLGLLGTETQVGHAVIGSFAGSARASSARTAVAGRAVFSETDRSCCACARSPRGDVPRGAREVAAADHVNQSQVVDALSTNVESRDVRRAVHDVVRRGSRSGSARDRPPHEPAGCRAGHERTPRSLGCAHGRPRRPAQ